jgi:hypothetical protein
MAVAIVKCERCLAETKVEVGFPSAVVLDDTAEPGPAPYEAGHFACSQCGKKYYVCLTLELFEDSEP